MEKKDKTTASFEQGLITNRDQIIKWRNSFTAIDNVFESKGYNVGGFDERTFDAQVKVLFALLVEKKIIKLDDIGTKLDQMSTVVEFR